MAAGTAVAAVVYKEGAKTPVVVFTNESPSSPTTLGFDATCIAVDPTDAIIAVGSEDNFIQLYSSSMQAAGAGRSAV